MRSSIWLALVALALGAFAGARFSRAGSDDRAFVLEQHDRILVEAPGCYASCRSLGVLRNCTVRESECHAVCTSLPECKADGLRPMRVCAIVRDRP